MIFYLNACPSLKVNYTTVAKDIKNYNKTLFLNPVENYEIRNIISSLKNKVSRGRSNSNKCAKVCGFRNFTTTNIYSKFNANN